MAVMYQSNRTNNKFMINNSKISEIAIMPDEQDFLKRLPKILDKPTNQDIANAKNYETVANTIYTKSIQFKKKLIKNIAWKSFVLLLYIFLVTYSLGTIVKIFDKANTASTYLLLAIFFVVAFIGSLAILLSIGRDYFFDLKGYHVTCNRINLLNRAKQVFNEHLASL